MDFDRIGWLIAMIVAAALLIFAVVVVIGFLTAPTARTPEPGDSFISIYHDAPRHVTCWVFKEGYAGGLSCIPDKDLP